MALCAFILPAFPVYAQNMDYFDLPPEQLLAAEVVSVSKRPEKLSQTPAAVYVITNEDIIRSGVTTIPDALRMAPGVQVAQQDTNSWAVSIRGFNAILAKRMLVLIDGRTVYNTLHGGVYWEAHNLTLDDVDRIEVVRGPGGTLWGANAVNGVINIITKKSGNTQGTQITGGYGSHERGFATARYGGVVGEDGFYRVYTNYFDRDNFQNLSGTSSNDEWSGNRAGFRADWGNYLTVSGDVYRSGADQNFETFSLTPPFATAEPETAVNKGGNLTAHWQHQLEQGGQISLQSYLDYASRDESVLSDERYIFDIEGQYNFQPMGRHSLITGAGYRYIMDNLSGSGLVTFSPASRNDPVYNAFIQDKIALVPDEWYLTLGSKFEHNFYTGFEYQPSGRLQWIPDETQSVWAAVSRAVSTPTRIERDLDITSLVLPPGVLPAPSVITLENNKNFDSEKLLAYELGYKKQLRSNLSLDLAVFYNEYHDMLSLTASGLTPVAGPPAHFLLPLEAENEQSAETYGGEATVAWTINDRWKLIATYSYLEIFAHAPSVISFSQETEEEMSPVHQVSLQPSWTINDNLSLDGRLYYVDEVPEQEIDDYFRLDLNFGWRIHKNLKFNLVGQNLLQDEHREFGSPTAVNAAEIERSIFGKFTWKF